MLNMQLISLEAIKQKIMSIFKKKEPVSPRSDAAAESAALAEEEADDKEWEG